MSNKCSKKNGEPCRIHNPSKPTGAKAEARLQQKINEIFAPRYVENAVDEETFKSNK